MSDYNWRIVNLDVVRMHREGTDCRVPAYMTIPIGMYDEEHECVPSVTVILDDWFSEGYRIYVYNTNEDGYADLSVEAYDDMYDYQMYGDMEVGLDPHKSPSFVECIEANSFDEFIAVCKRYI